MQEEDELNGLESDVVESESESEESQESQEEQQPEPPKDEEKEEFSRRVNKRIDKLVYERNVAREENAKLLARLEALEQARQKEDEERSKQSFESRKREAIQRKIDAMEIGDHAGAAEADADLISVIAEEKSYKPTQPQPKPVANQPSAEDQWVAANQWVHDPTQKQRYDKANKIFLELINEGYDRDDPDLYAEMDTRLAKSDKPRTAPPPTGAPDRGQAVGSQGKTFTAQDKQKMRDWGLDPDNESHRKEWIRNKG